MSDQLHYLDYAASAPLRPQCADALIDTYRRYPANPSGAHRAAREARRALDGARAEIAEVVGARPGEVIFTSGGTEADNLAIRGVMSAAGRDPGRPTGLVVSQIEHHAVLDSAAPFGPVVCPVDQLGHVDLDALSDLLSPDVALVSVMLVNNEIGSVNDLAAVKAVMAKRCPEALLHTDAVQAMCWVDLRTAAAPADLISIGAHKLGGPRGIGALIVRAGVPIAAQQVGGGQERERRSGTQDTAGAVAFAVAARRTDADREWECARLESLAERMIDGITASVADVSFTPRGVPGIVHLCVRGAESETLLVLLERDGVMASAASSCASGAQQRSHVLDAIGVDPADAAGALRLSLGYGTTNFDVDTAVSALAKATATARSFGVTPVGSAT